VEAEPQVRGILSTTTNSHSVVTRTKENWHDLSVIFQLNMETLILERKKKVGANQMATYFMTSESTLRNFCVIRMFKGYYTMVKLRTRPDFKLVVEFSAHELHEKFDTDVVAIDRRQYDKFMNAYEANIKTMFMKSNETPEDCPKSKRFRLTNPHWRMAHLATA